MKLTMNTNKKFDKKFEPPDCVSLNELRVSKKELSEFNVSKFHFSLNQARELKQYLYQKECLVVRGGSQFVYVMKTQKDNQLKADMPSHLHIEYGENLQFEQLPCEIARRFLFSFIENVAKPKGYIRGEGWQLYSPESQRENFSYGYYAVDIGIREESSYYSIFLDPTTLVLVPLPLLSPSYLVKGRLLRKLVTQEDEFLMNSFSFSRYPGRAGFFDGFADSTISQIHPETLVSVIPTKKSEKTLNYPAFALKIVAQRSEFGALGINTLNAQKLMQPLSHKRLKETKQWAKKLFPNDQLTLNDRSISVENHVNLLNRAIKYQPKSQNKYIYYSPIPLLFDTKGTQTNFSQKPGLKQYKPYDSNTADRPFNAIKPYLIVPGLQIANANQLMDFLAGDYKRRPKTSFPDDDFSGINTYFDVQFDPPDENDIIVVEDTTIADYLDATESILYSWAKESEKEGRIVVVVVPNKNKNGNDNENDPYILVKKRLVEAGLPSQMIEVETLNQVADTSMPFGHTLWTFALDLYVKLGGKPWTLARPINDVNCLIGLGFGRSPKKMSNPIYIGIANVFDQGGQWLDLNSDDHELTDEEWQSLKDEEQNSLGTSSFKLHHEMSANIISQSLKSYYTKNNQVAKKVVFHKNGDVYESEALGFLQSLSENVLNNRLPLSSARFALVSIYKNHNIRMYGPNFPEILPMDYTITKGSAQILNENTAVIATTGKNPFGYSGIGTPAPLIVQRFVPSEETFSNTGFNLNQMYSIQEICEHVFSLTRLHWGTTNDIRLPITSDYAQKIAEFLARTEVNVAFLLKSKRLWWI